MLPRRLKALYFALIGPIVWLNGWRHRRLSTWRKHPLRVHLGPGRFRYFDNWVNVDANVVTTRCDVWADMNQGLPFPNGSVDAVYSYHTVEHLRDQAFFWRELQRCLAPGGVFRIGGPNGDAAIERFLAGDTDWFGDQPHKRRSTGGRLENFLFCGGEHLTILTFSFMEELASDAGLGPVTRRLPMTDTGFPEIFDEAVMASEYESRPDIPYTLIVEGRKPA